MPSDISSTGIGTVPGAYGSTWRAWLGFAGTGCSGALAYRGDWAAAVVIAVCVLAPAVAWLRGELLAARAMLRSLAEMSEAAGQFSGEGRVRSSG